MAEMFLDPIMEKLISAGFRYLKDQVRWQTGMKEDLVKLKGILPQIQTVVLHFASNQEQITDPALKEWYWQFRDAIDDADGVLDELEYMELEKQVNKSKKLRTVHSIMKLTKKKLDKIFKRAAKIDPTLKRLEGAVQKLDKVAADVTNILPLLDRAKEQVVAAFHGTGSLPTNDLIGRGREKEDLVRWLRTSNEEHQALVNGTDLYRNISLLSIVGHGGMGKTTLLQHVYNDEMTKEFCKMWVFVSKNFDVIKVYADMFESLEKKRPPLKTLDALQQLLRDIVSSSKKFLLVLDDIWMDEENNDISKWEAVFGVLAHGKFGSKILVTTRMASVATMFEGLIRQRKKIFTLNMLNDDDCLNLLKSHAFPGAENSNNHNISIDIFKKLSGYPLAAKVIARTIISNEKDWRTILERESITSLGKNHIYSILRPSYISLPNHLRNCFAFCCLFPQDYLFDKDDLIRMWNSLGFILSSHDQQCTVEDIGGRYFDDLVKKSFFDEVEESPRYKMHIVLHETASKIYPEEYSKIVDEELSPKIPKTIRHLYIQTINLDILKKIGKAKHLRSLFLPYEDANQDFCNALIKDSKSLRLLHIRTPSDLKMIPDDFGNLKHLRYLKIERQNLTMLPRSSRNLFHLQYIIYKGPRCFNDPKLGYFLRDINYLGLELCHMDT